MTEQKCHKCEGQGAGETKEKQPMTSTFDPAKPFKTRDGLPARLVGRQSNEKYPLVVALMSPRGHEWVNVYTEDGRLSLRSSSHKDLVNLPEKRTVWRFTVLYTKRWQVPETRWFFSEDDAVAAAGILGAMDGWVILDPPHPFAYEVPECTR